MQSKWGTKAKRSEKVDQQRRKVVKLMAAGGAGAITSPWMFQSSRAAGQTIKIGMVTPETGPIAAFGEAVEMGLPKASASSSAMASWSPARSIRSRSSIATASRIRTARRKWRRSSSTTTRSTSWSRSSTGDTANPVADQCELSGVPCITSDDPWQAWFFGRKGDPKKGFEWTYHFFWGFDMVANMFADMWLTHRRPTRRSA